MDSAVSGVRRLILDSLRYWVNEMGVDGFRFDLATTLFRDERHHVDMATHPIRRAIAEDPVLSRVKLIAEPWDLGPYGYQLGSYGADWSEWNDRFRNFVREFWRGNTSGVSELAVRLAGSADVFDRDGGTPAPASTSSPLTTASPCGTWSPTTSSTTGPTVRETGTAPTTTGPSTAASKARPTTRPSRRSGCGRHRI